MANKTRFFDLLEPDVYIDRQTKKPRNRYAHNRLVTYFCTRWASGKWDHETGKFVRFPTVNRRRFSWHGKLYRVHIGRKYFRVYDASGKCVIFRPKYSPSYDEPRTLVRYS